ncbi:hypothetical protein ACFL0Z_03435 [Patescibacteria group bacterium]
MSVCLTLKQGVSESYPNAENKTIIHDLRNRHQAAMFHQRLAGLLASLGRDEYVDVVLEIVEPLFRDPAMERNFITHLVQLLYLQLSLFADEYENTDKGRADCNSCHSGENQIALSLRLRAKKQKTSAPC